MKKSEFIKVLAKKNGMTLAKARQACDDVFGCLSRCLQTEDKVKLDGLGVFHASKDELLGNERAFTFDYKPTNRVLRPTIPPVGASSEQALVNGIGNAIKAVGVVEFMKMAAEFIRDGGVPYEQRGWKDGEHNPRTCVCCGASFIPYRPSHKLCSESCRIQYEKIKRAHPGKMAVINM